MNNCKHCQFWKKGGDEYTPGQCRRHAPVVLQYREADTGEAYGITYWPKTKATDGCAEFVSNPPMAI